MKNKNIWYNEYGDNMETKKKILFFIVTTVLLGTITFLIVRNMENKNTSNSEEVEEPKAEAKTEDINYEKYLELRSLAHEAETYAIVIHSGSDQVSKDYLKDVKSAFTGKKATVYLLDVDKLTEEDYSRVIDDMTEISKHEKPELTVPATIIMSKGAVIYSHEGLILKEELMNTLNAKSVE